MKSMHTLAYSQGTRWRKQTENYLELWLVSLNCHSLLPSLHQVPTPASLALVQLSTATKAAAAKESVHT